MKTIGESIISWQMLGLTIGGILWGILGDKKGRAGTFWFNPAVFFSNHCQWICY
jgi:MFS family permease